MIFLLAFGAIGFGGVLILLIARYAPHPHANRAALARVIAGGQPMPYDEFRALLIDLFDALKLEIVMIHGSPTAFDLILRSTEPLTGGRYLAHAIWEVPGDIVEQSAILALQETVKADGAQKGILITPYAILSDGLGNLEAPIELVDGKALRNLVEHYLPASRLDALAKYRGFGL